MSKSSIPDTICAELPTQIHGPAHEYIRLMRSYLTETQLAFVSDQVEAMVQDGRASVLAYADLLRSMLAPEQRREVTLYLAGIYYDRGWISEGEIPDYA